jgi:hypothetical protein
MQLQNTEAVKYFAMEEDPCGDYGGVHSSYYFMIKSSEC